MEPAEQPANSIDKEVAAEKQVDAHVEPAASVVQDIEAKNITIEAEGSHLRKEDEIATKEPETAQVVSAEPENANEPPQVEVVTNPTSVDNITAKEQILAPDDCVAVVEMSTKSTESPVDESKDTSDIQFTESPVVETLAPVTETPTRQLSIATTRKKDMRKSVPIPLPRTPQSATSPKGASSYYPLSLLPVN
jgi:hypothetical protein